MTIRQKISKKKTQCYGWIPDLPDQRDLKFAVSSALLAPLPQSVDLRAGCPPIYDQGVLNSCTANAIAAAYQFDEIKQNEPVKFQPSRLFIYYNERQMEGTVNSDSGAMIRDGIKSINQVGVCPESMWSYSQAFNLQPSDDCFINAAENKAVSYQNLDVDINIMKGCLAGGYPFVFGFTVYESFEEDGVKTSGIMPMPAQDEAVVGGHAVLAVGYDDAKQMMIVRNSWGVDWGLSGYFMMPYAYISNSNLVADFWTIRTVQDAI